MLKLLRRYQRILFLFITAVVVISFSFFGTFGAVDREERSDLVVATYADGSSVTAREVQQMIRFLTLGNPHQVRSDFFETRLSPFVARHYLEGRGKLEFWMDKEGIEKVALLYLKGAQVAEECGYFFSKEAVRAKLLVLQRRRDPKEAELFLRAQMRRANLLPSEGLAVYEKILLFQALLEGASDGLLLDSALYKPFAHFATLQMEASRYDPPKLFTANKEKLGKYLEAIGATGDRFPATFPSPQEVARRAPELVQERALLEVKVLPKSELAHRVSLKRMWEWETSDPGFRLLTKSFPVLGKSGIKTAEDRLHAIDELESALKAKVEKFARSRLIEDHPEWKGEGLAAKREEVVRVAFRGKGMSYPFTEVKQVGPLLRLIEGAEVQGEPFLYETEDHFYEVKVLEKPRGKEIMTFEEALEMGALQEGGAVEGLASKYLAAAHKSIEEEGESSPYLTETGDPFRDQWLVRRKERVEKPEDLLIQEQVREGHKALKFEAKKALLQKVLNRCSLST